MNIIMTKSALKNEFYICTKEDKSHITKMRFKSLDKLLSYMTSLQDENGDDNEVTILISGNKSTRNMV